MICNKCIELHWPIRQKALNDGLCIFHTSRENKACDVKTFNAKFFDLFSAYVSGGVRGKTYRQYNFDGIIFPGDIVFFAYFQKVARKPQISFKHCIYYGFSDFSNVVFHNSVMFTGSKFYSASYFTNAVFLENANFFDCKFNDVALFKNTIVNKKLNLARIHAKRNMVHIDGIDEDSVSKIMFDPSEVDAIQFSIQKWPENLYVERRAKDYFIKSETLYRCLKQKAATEHDQRMVSHWHYREKMMALAQLQGGAVWKPWKSITWWYYCCSGFGEDPKRAIKFFAGIFFAAFLVLCGFKLWETGWSPYPDWNKFFEIFAETLALIPLVKSGAVADPSKVSLIVPIKRFVVSLMQIPVSVQIALFAFALRNRFRR